MPGDCSCEVCPFMFQKYRVRLGCGAEYNALSETVIESHAEKPLLP